MWWISGIWWHCYEKAFLFAGISNELPIFAEMLIHFRFGENRVLLGQEISKGHAGFFRGFFY
jgi:hypothetical protein